ncbi:DUF2851 family protein [Paraflavisolibacter sp. H34]|uniref:DUF2851 family protein n=1 Tax=Huijunlia imazamoxiresistens TaxID=3127457 RepID=UPI0030164867
MTEKLLHYLWQFQYFNRSQLLTAGGEPLQVISTGRPNAHQGPDFTDAKIKIGDTLFAGSVELHYKASEWKKHGHETDPNYRNVVLHVVFENDEALHNNIPVLELHPHIPKLMLERYEGLMHSTAFIACASSTASVRDLVWVAWKERLLAERLTRKSDTILERLEQSRGHWEETFWWLLARNFGYRVNADAFEAVARSLPVTLLARHKSSIHQLEALLLGQAGLLEREGEDPYVQLLRREYRFLQAKCGLKHILLPVHFLRMRPPNFPTVRLAQLAMLVHGSTHLFSKVLETDSLKEVRQWLDVTANDFWHYHYTLGEASGFRPKKLGAAMAENIIINTLVPVLFAYGRYHGEEGYKTKALRWLEEAAAEENAIISGFRELPVASRSAYDSQALLELKNEYCDHKRCLECSIGNSLLKQEL